MASDRMGKGAGARRAASVAVIVAAVASVPKSASAQNLLVNGSFESPVISAASQGTQTFASIPGWTRVAGSVVELQSSALKAAACTPNNAANGTQWWEAAGDDPTTLQQTVTTQPGATYRLTLSFAPRNLTPAVNRLNVVWNGSVALSINVPPSTTVCNSPFTTFTVDLVAAGASSILQLAHPGLPAVTEGSEVDNVSLVLLPPDLQITKSHTGSFVQGQNGTYTLAVANAGTGPTFGLVTVTDTVPATGLTVTAMSGTGWSCTATLRTCNRSDILASASSYPPISVTVSVASNAPIGSLTNMGAVSTPGDPNVNNDVSSDPTNILGVSDLTVSKTHSGTFERGQVGTYMLTVSNVGTAASSGLVMVTDTLPAGLTLADISGPGWICTPGTLSCTRSNALPAGSSYPAITVQVNVLSGSPGSVSNTVTVAGGGETNTTNDTAQDSTTIVDPPPGPDLVVAKSHGGAFVQGQSGSYVLTVTNVGGMPTSGQVNVTENPPAGLTVTGLSGPGWTCGVPTRVCSRSDSLASASSYPDIAVVVSVAGDAAASLTNVAVVSGGGDSNPANNTATDPTSVTPTAPPVDLTITKLHTGTFERGQTGAYTLTVVNVSNGTSSGPVNVVEAPPSGLLVVAIGGDGWSCTLAPPSCTRADPLGPGLSFPPITVTAVVAATAAASVTNYATVSGGGDANAANNKARDQTAIVDPPGFPDITIAKSHDAPFLRGQSGQYTLVVTNIGGVASSGLVSVTDTLPAGLTATSIAGVGWDCIVATRLCTRSDALGPGGSYPPITLTVTVAANMALGLTPNSAVVAGGADSNPANNTAVDSTLISAPPAFVDLTINKSHVGDFLAGQPNAYSLVVTNASTMASNGPITVTDTLPAGMTATAIAGPGWTCTLASLSCARSDVLAGGASAPPIIVTVLVGAGTPPGSVSNMATVSGGGDTDPTNNGSSDSTTIVSITPLVPTLSDVERVVLLIGLLAIGAWMLARRDGLRNQSRPRDGHV